MQKKKAANWADVSSQLHAQKKAPTIQLQHDYKQQPNPPFVHQQPQTTQNDSTADGWARLSKAAALAEQQEQNKKAQQAMQEQPKQLNQKKQGAWFQFQPQEEPYDDKVAYNKVSPDLKRTHAVWNPNQQQQNNQKKKQRNQHQQQKVHNNNPSNQKQQRNQRQSRQNTTQLPQEQPQYQSNTEFNEPPPQIRETQSQPQAPVLSEENSIWGEIRSALAVAPPFDDKNEIRKVAPELRRSHNNKPVQQEQPKNNQHNNRQRNNKKADNKNKGKDTTNAPAQEQVQSPQVEQQVEEETQPHKVIPPWAVINSEAPYDDSKDVRKVPAEFRRSHALNPHIDEKKSNQKQQKHDQKQKPRKEKNEKRVSDNRNKQRSNQNQKKKKNEGKELKTKIHKAWSDLSIKMVEPKPQRPSPIQPEVSQPQEEEQNQQIAPQEEQIHQLPPQEEKQNPEPVPQQKENNTPDYHEEEEEYHPHQLIQNISPVWANLTEEQLKAPAKKQPRFVRPKQPVEEEKKVPQPSAEAVQPSSPQPSEEQPTQNTQNEAVEEEEDENEEIENPEVKSLAPSENVVHAWGTIRNIQSYDDKNDWRKVPADLRRSHIQQINTDNNNNKKQAQKNKNKKNKKNQTKVKEEQTQESKTEEPTVSDDSIHIEENTQENPSTTPVKPSIWSLNIQTPYDDSHDHRKLPAELKRTHNLPIEQSEESKNKNKARKNKNEEKHDRKSQKKLERIEAARLQEIDVDENQQNNEVSSIEVQAQKSSSPWSTIDNTPYDDKRDLNKVPPEFRQSHHKQIKEEPQQNNKKQNNQKKKKTIKVEKKAQPTPQ